jgi:hypothetical protein
MISSVTEKKPPRLTRVPKTRATASKTRNLLPNRTSQSRTAATTLPRGVDAAWNRTLAQFFAEQIEDNHVDEDVDDGRPDAWVQRSRPILILVRPILPILVRLSLNLVGFILVSHVFP